MRKSDQQLNNEDPICPDCGDTFAKIGCHWARSKDCDYPVLSRRAEQILDGMMLVGGSLKNRHREDANCFLSIVHQNYDVLEWITSELGVVAASVTEFDQTDSIDYYERKPDGGIWELRTRSLPALSKYFTWYDRDDQRTVPTDMPVRPGVLKTACLLAARPMEDRPGLYLSLRRTTPPKGAVHRVFGGYGPRIIENEQGGYVVRIQNSTDLCNDLGPWPSFSRDRFDPDQFDEGRVVCPRCGGRFRTRSHICEYIGDGTVVREEDATHGGSRELIRVDGMRARPHLVDADTARYVDWSIDECTEALREEYGSPDNFPSNQDHSENQQGREDLPSLGTLYRRFGSRSAWLEAIAAAPEF